MNSTTNQTLSAETINFQKLTKAELFQHVWTPQAISIKDAEAFIQDPSNPKEAIATIADLVRRFRFAVSKRPNSIHTMTINRL